MRDVHRFGADYLMQQGYDVELWTVYEKNVTRKRSSDSYYIGDNWKKINKKKFQVYVEDDVCADTVFFVIGGMYKFLPVLLRQKRDYAYIMVATPVYELDSGALHGNVDGMTRWQKLKKYITIYGIEYVLGMVSRQLVDEMWRNSRNRGIYEYIRDNYRKVDNYLIAVANSEGEKVIPDFMRPDAVKIHSYDYDRYIELERRNLTESIEHIVFIDQGFADLHLDMLDSKEYNAFKKKDSRELLRKQLNRCFSLLEDYYELPVVIAAHPHVIYQGTFEGRKLVFGKTEELVKNARFVVMHMSTAVSFVVLYNKPALVVYNDSFMKMKFGMDIQENCRLLGYEAVNLDSDRTSIESLNEHIMINKHLYEEYKKRFLMGDNDEYDEKLVIEVIEKNFLNRREIIDG